MNDQIRKININSLLFWDIETASQEKKLDPKSEAFRVFQYKNRDKVTDTLLGVKETQELYAKTAALSPIYGKIIAIGIGYVKGSEIVTKTLIGEEIDILKEAIQIFTTSNGRILTGYNSNGFDIVYFRMRCYANGLEIPESLTDVGLKPWKVDTKFYDLMKYFQGVSPFRYSLDEACLLLGIKSPKESGVKGSEVSKAYHEGKIEKIATYVTEDIKATVNLLLRMQGKPIIE